MRLAGGGIILLASACALSAEQTHRRPPTVAIEQVSRGSIAPADLKPTTRASFGDLAFSGGTVAVPREWVFEFPMVADRLGNMPVCWLSESWTMGGKGVKHAYRMSSLVSVEATAGELGAALGWQPLQSDSATMAVSLGDPLGYEIEAEGAALSIVVTTPAEDDLPWEKVAPLLWRPWVPSVAREAHAVLRAGNVRSVEWNAYADEWEFVWILYEEAPTTEQREQLTRLFEGFTMDPGALQAWGENLEWFIDVSGAPTDTRLRIMREMEEGEVHPRCR